MTQLALKFEPRRTAPRQLPPIERLRALLARRGIDWRYRATRGSILFRPMFGPHFGWQPMCGFYMCQDICFERMAYREYQPDTSREGRDEVQALLAARRESIDALWGKP